jgi:hypothetical protein
MSFSRKSLRRASITLTPDVYAGRILAAKLETLDEVAQTFGVDRDEPEFLTLREGYIARARVQAVKAVTEPVTPHFVAALKALDKRSQDAIAKARAAVTP